MTRVTLIKLALAAAGVSCFFTGVRLDSDAWRWAGIALASVAWLLRFIERGRRRGRYDSPQDPSM